MFVMKEKLLRIVTSAGKIVKDNFYKSVQVSEKEPKDLVTNIDKEVEVYIRDEIKKIYPQSYSYGEEYGYAGDKSTHLFVIDPIDGTANFIFGVPYFAVSLAEIIDDKVITGIVYNPITEDLFYADESGAYLNGEQIKVSDRSELKDSYVIFGFSVNKENIDKYEKEFPKSFTCSKKGLPLLSPSLNLCMVALGKADGFIDFGCSFEGQVAGSYILERAGGVVTNYDRSKNDYKITGVVANNGKINLE